MDELESENLDSKRAREKILRLEKEIDCLLAEGKIDQWTGWESYFALMYEANLWNLYDLWKRLRSKIDKEKFNPFLSKNPDIILITKDILRRQGFSGDNNTFFN